jgi:plastocyanin
MRALILTLALLSLALAGCTGGGDQDAYTTPPQDDQGRYVIEVGPGGQFTFSPKMAKVPANSTVVWINQGGFHNVAAEDGSFRSGDAKTGDWEFEHTFEAAGEFHYKCEPHQPQMSGTILVE